METGPTHSRTGRGPSVLSTREYWAGQLMQPEWMIDIPEDLSSQWCVHRVLHLACTCIAATYRRDCNTLQVILCITNQYHPGQIGGGWVTGLLGEWVVWVGGWGGVSGDLLHLLHWVVVVVVVG